MALAYSLRLLPLVRLLAAMWLAALLGVAQAHTEAALQARVAANASDMEAHVLLAKGYLDAGKASEALPHLKAAATLRPDASPLVFQYGVTQLDAGDLPGGYATLSALAKREPNEAATRAYLVRATALLNKPEETREHLATLRRLVPNDALFHAQLVEWTATAGDPAVALEQTAYALTLPLPAIPTGRVRFLESFAHNRLGHREQAMASLQEAIKLDDGKPQYCSVLLTLQGASGMKNMDVAMLKQAMQRFPTSPDLLLLTGLYNLETEEYKAVREIAGRLDIVAPGSAEATLLRGHLHLVNFEFDAAVKQFELALGRGMATPHLLEHLGRAQEKAGREKEALVTYARALAMEGTRPELLFSFAQLRLNTGDASGARKLLARLLQLEPENARAHKLLADTERRLGNAEASAKHLAEFKRLSIAAQATRKALLP